MIVHNQYSHGPHGLTSSKARWRGKHSPGAAKRAFCCIEARSKCRCAGVSDSVHPGRTTIHVVGRNSYTIFPVESDGIFTDGSVEIHIPAVGSARCSTANPDP